jgi:hypothetical protein
MKKQLLFLAAFFVSTLAMAQVKTTAGVRAGYSSASIKGEAVQNLDKLIDITNGAITSGNHSGVFAGAYVALPLTENISLEPALYYAQKGYTLNGALSIKGADFLSANARAALNLHYIDMPVVLKGTVGGFQVFAGPQVSYLAKADLRTVAGALGFNVLDRTMDATQQFNRWDASVTAGVGYQFTNGLNVMAAYDHGLSRVDANRNLNSYNRSFKVGLGFTF